MAKTLRQIKAEQAQDVIDIDNCDAIAETLCNDKLRKAVRRCDELLQMVDRLNLTESVLRQKIDSMRGW